MSTIYKVLIADDHAILRDGIRYLITRMKNMKVVGEAVSGQEALQKFEDLHPTCLFLIFLCRIKMACTSLNKYWQRSPEANIIILSMYDDDEYITRCLELGVKGYVVKNESGTELELAIQSVMEGKNYFSSQVRKSFLENIADHCAKQETRACC